MYIQKQFNAVEAKQVGDALAVDWYQFDIEQFRLGLESEYKLGNLGAQTHITDDDVLTTGKIALIHLRKIPDYYTHLSEMEEESDAYWADF